MHNFFLESATVGITVDYPDSIDEESTLDVSAQLAGFSPRFLPAESIFMGYQPNYPSLIDPDPPLPEGVLVGTSHAAIVDLPSGPMRWRPGYPDEILYPEMEADQQLAYFLAPIGELIEIGARQSWKPKFPDEIEHPHQPEEGGMFFAIPPFVPAAGIDCVELVDDSFAVPVLDEVVFGTPTLLEEEFTVPRLVEEDLC
jgi:hypothetical protein